MGESCYTCFFWMRWPHTKTIGTCKRYPSQYVGDEHNVIGMRPVKDSWGAWEQPVMSERGWCGEHKPSGPRPAEWGDAP